MLDNHDRITELVEKTSDPVQKAMLLLFVQFDHALAENTRATSRIADALEAHKDDFRVHTSSFGQHVLDERELINEVSQQHNRATAKISGAVAAGTVLISAFLAVGGFTVKRYADSVDATASVVYDLIARVRVLEVQAAELRR